jgi:serine protease Do
MDDHSNRNNKWPIIIGLFIALALGAAAGSIITAKTGNPNFNQAAPIPLVVSGRTPVRNGDVSFENGFSSVVSAVLPTVVNISSSKIVQSPADQSNPFMDPLRQFFGNHFGKPRERRERNLGSGVMVSPDGYILTNNHVVGGSASIIVSLMDKREFKARIIGTDPKTDIAVIKLDAKNLPVITFGNSSDVKVGDFALAVGSPFGLAQTVTMGIVSAKGRVNLGIEDYEDFIQTDSSINPGNSGGALVNSRGELIGINTAILSSGSSNQGIGFAIPINMARQMMAQILKNGKVVRAYLGAWIQPVTPEIAQVFHLPKSEGALVGDVEKNSPAGKGGLERGDIIIANNGASIKDAQEFRMKIAMYAPGTKIGLKVLRNGSERNIALTLTEMPAKEQPRVDSQKESEVPGSLQGIDVEKMSPVIARRLELFEGQKGVVVANVESGSAADNAGLQRGDVILEINRKGVADVNDFNRIISAKASGPTLLLIRREGNTMYIVVNY